MRTKFFLFVSILAAALVLSACGAVGSPANHTLSVSGSGTVSVTPDIAYINVGVHTENADLSTAVNQNNTQTQTLIESLKKAGIADADIQTSNFNIYTMNQGYDKVTGQPIDGKVYAVDNTVYVTVRDLSKLGSLLSTGINSGANNINGITFDVADKSKAFAEARKAALADAGAVAAELAKNANLKLGGIQSLNYVHASNPLPLYGMGGGGAQASSVSDVPVQPGKLQVSVTVDVTYELK